ncbi:MAG: DUF58 domain-containing protein [Spirochaetes bacterium]|nr:DUF58 domain-containing protein [Spirochaetota bacterium]
MKPGISLFTGAVLWLCLGVGGFFSTPLSLVWFLSGLLLLFVIIADALFLGLMIDTLKTERSINTSLSLGEQALVRLKVEKSGKGFLAAKIRLFDIYPSSMACQTFPVILDRKGLQNNVQRKPEDHALIFEYFVTPMQRGEWEFPELQLLFNSPLHFWQRKVIHSTKTAGRTYPDFKKLLALAGQDLREVLERVGLKNIRKRGQGLEFQSLREYQLGDPVKAIDWRATARRQKPIIREYQEEQDQQVLFLLDTGYRLHRQEGEYMQFDTALNAVLLLSYVALKHEDSVAVGTFGNEERWLQPRKGMSTLTGLMNNLYDLYSAPVPSSLFSALENALARLNRRTLIILISNFREEDGESLSWILPRIRKRHLLLTVSLREQEAETLSTRRPANMEEAMESAAAFSYLFARQQLYKKWEHSGLLTLEASIKELSPALISSYLSVKRSGAL